MSFPRYDEYRDSGVEWLGSIPNRWRLVPLFAVADPRNESNAGMIDDNLLSLSYGRVVRKDIASNDGLLPDSFETYQIVRTGDVVLRLTDLQNDQRSLRTALVGETGIISPAYLALRPHSMEPRFLAYLLRAYDSMKIFYSMGSGLRQSMKFADLKRLPVVVPPTSEQQTVANFLDRETSKLESLIDDQQRLIELLQEKRQAVISHAVTKGLNPDAPMKRSGIQWLGDVPTHWTVLQLGRLCRVVADGPHYSPPYVDDGVPFLSARNIKVDRWDLSDVKYVSPQLCEEFDRRVIPELGDILYTKGGTTGVARVVDLPGRFQVWVHVAVLKLRRELADPEFVALALNGSSAYEQAQLYTRGATNQDLGLTRMIRIVLALPPMAEQRKITRCLRERLAGIDSLVSDAEHAIALLEERRAALISAAVTGKIDVRGLVNAEAVAA